MRITGFSGMDIDTMVSQLMTASRAPLDKLNQQKQLLNWQRDSYRELNSKLFDFRNNKPMSFNKSAQLNTQKAVVTGNTDAVKVEASPTAQNIPMTISVVNLAKAASVEMQGLDGIKSSKTLKDLGGDTSQKYTIKIGGKSGGTSKELEFDANTTISTVISRINSDPDANAVASFDEITGKLTISSKTTGEKSNITVENGSKGNSILELFGAAKGSSLAAQNGENAHVVINGKEYKDLTSNTLTVNGINLTFLSETGLTKPADNATYPINQSSDATAVKVSIQTDPEKSLSTIKSFIEEYNTLISYMNTKSSEEKYRDYAPLTDEQKKEMSDNDIELWEERSKSGLLKNDEIIKSTISSMRSIITENLSQLSALGITTGQYYENGKLYLDEEKFNKAIQADPQKLTEIFQGTGSSSGIFSKMSETINGSLDKLVTKAGTSKYSGDLNSIFKEESTMGRQLKDYNKRIEAFQNKLENLEIRYYKQFTAMEAAMNQYNSQSASLASYFSQ
ncbi:flagellar filament capping protein FliD [Paenibacillus urinalis]|uniref:Flagellar hook-associated protein 2 n=1 Tax=Paenibacillus urinalis TaxID=521520 RepID=A0ABY7X825_9BACL|nr:flagellar filament capping protein FliD [Paenibacillus urinalis]WDH98282.1 flagellar filament capping protein FliD [Paenibacillus urinalis]WDI01968.1 flagellar filament capping protein FliD [Paenibacillus urinalis]